MKKAAIPLGAVIAAFLIVPHIANAQSAILIAGQSETGATSTNQYNASSQMVGTGLIGRVSTIQWKMRGNISGAGTLNFKAVLSECTDATNTTCTTVGETQSDSVNWPSGFSTQDYSAQMVTSYRLDYSKYYLLTWNFTGGGGTGSVYIAGSNSPVYTHGTQQEFFSGAGTPDPGMVAAYYDLIGEFDSSGLSIGSATSSSIFSGQDATSTLSDLNEQCSQAGNVFAQGICVAFSFLFIPSPSTLDAFFGIPDVAAEKFPFSWIFGVKDEFSSLTASSTANMVSLNYDFHDLGIGSTTPMGNILPNLTVFSSSTITAYLGSTLWNTFQTLISAALWLGLIAYIFNHSRRLAEKRT